MKYQMVESMESVPVEKGSAFFIIDDKDLVHVIETSREKSFIIGKDIGIISYNDTCLKQVVDVGITTISTDFSKMGQRMAQMVLNKERRPVDNGGNLIVRNSL